MMGGQRKEIDFEEEDVCWWVWWVFRCDAMMLCFWLAVGLIEELGGAVREGTIS